MKQLITTLIVVCLFSSTVFATIGPPTADLARGKSAISIDYLDFELDEADGTQVKEATFENTGQSLRKWTEETDFVNAGLDTTSVFATWHYGVTDKINTFLQVGMSELDSEEKDVAYGVGIKGTVYEKNKWKIGALLHWQHSSWKGDTPTNVLTIPWYDGYGRQFGTSKMPLIGEWESSHSTVEIAVGPTYQVNDWCTVYGGPYWHYISGDFNYDVTGHTESPRPGSTVTLDMTESLDAEFDQSALGFFVGTQLNFNQIALSFEYQKTSDIEQVGLNAVYRF